MSSGNWEEKYWSALIHKIREENCILMLGPEIAVEETENGHFSPLTEILAKELAKNLNQEIKKHIDVRNLAQTAQYYLMETGRDDLEDEVCDFYAKRQHLTSEPHKNLATLPFYLAITSTPDDMFVNALKEAKKPPLIGRYHFDGENPNLVKIGTAKTPLVYYLYGTTKEPRSLVLTENNLLDFLVAVSSKTPPLSRDILSELRDKNKSFLFLGFGFKYWYLRVLLRSILGDQRKPSRSFALEQFTPNNIGKFQDTIFFYEKSDYKVYICNQELPKFVKELKTRYGHPKPQKQAGPKVFICHAKENKDVAAFLCQRLEAAGFRPWFDQEDIRGGQQWDRTIEEAIHSTDYFVVLQSQDMAKKFKSYFYKEIRVALTQYDYFERGIQFIIPLKIHEDCPLLKDLKEFQTIDVSDEQNIEQLIDVIRKDYEKRALIVNSES